MMINVKKAVMAAGVAVALSACGANPSSAITPTNPSNPQTNVLQFAVGTANLYGNPTKGLNVVVTFRQPAGGYNPGDSAALVSSPSIRLAGKLPTTAGTPVSYDALSTAWSGPAPQESGSLITSTSQIPFAKNITTFGQSGGAFGIGIEPFNYYGPYDAPVPYDVNTPFQVAPYPVPLYEPCGSAGSAGPPVCPGDANLFEPWGGPPAFDLLGNGTSPVDSPVVPAGTAGVSQGLDVFNTVPKTGSYKLSVLVASNIGNVTQTKTASLNSAVGLPLAVAPPFVANASGGGTFAFSMPAGATEAYIQVTDYGPIAASGTTVAGCNGAQQADPAAYIAGTEIYYTILAKSSGTLTLPGAAGPGGTPSLCTAAQNTASNGGTATAADSFTVQVIAFDYPMYEASYPASLHNPSPTIRGARGQDDVTISAASCVTYGSAAPCVLPFPGQPAIARRAAHHRHH
jgi:hypothetical protein